MSAMKATETKPLERIAGRFEAIGGELRERARLATEEARRAWDRAHLERVTRELATARDEARVQLHLAGLDARDAFHAMESRVAELRDKAGLGVDHVADDLSKRLHRLSTALRGATLTETP